MKRGVKVGLYSLGGVFVVVVAVLIGGYFFVRSAAGSRFILSQAKGILHKKDIVLEYKEGHIDPFSVVRFKNLRLTKRVGNEEMDVTVPLLEMQYAVSILSRRVDVDKIRIEKPSITYRSISKTAAVSPTEEQRDLSSSKREDLLQKVRDF